MKRFVCLLLVITISLTGFTSTALAVDDSSTVGTWAVSNRINNASNSLNYNLQGDYGLLLNLKHLTQQAVWTEYAYRTVSNNNLGDDERFSSQEIQILRERLRSNVLDYNQAYNNVSSEYIVVGSDLIRPSGYNLAYDMLSRDIPEIVEIYLESMSREYDLEADEDKDAYIRSKRGILKELAEIMNYGLESEDLTGINISQRYNEIYTNPNYEIMIRQAVAINEEDLESYTDVTYKPADSYIAALSNMMVTDQGIRSEDSTYSLTAQYLAMVAASSVYIPFSSHTGDEDFMTALENIVNNDSEYVNISQLYMKIKNTKKPLYFIQCNEEQGTLWKSKEAQRVTIEMFLDICGAYDKIYSGVFVMEKGILDRVEDDTDSWAYFQPDFSKVGRENVESNMVDTSIPVDTTLHATETQPNQTRQTQQNSLDDSYSSDNTQMVFKAGAVQKMADSYVMDGEKIPDASSCTEPVFGVGNWGKRMMLGKSIMLNNILSNKTIESISNKHMRLVYMNAFGDIVLDDNTVILPGAANPYMYDEKFGFSPYSVAVMNNLPDIVSDSERVILNSKDSEGKYIFGAQGKVENEKRDKLPSQKYYVYKLNDNAVPIVGWHITDDAQDAREILPLYTHSMPVSVGGESTNIVMFKTKDTANFRELLGQIGSQCPLVKINWNLNGDPIFPYTRESSSANSFISRNMYWTYTTSTGVESEIENGRIRSQYVIENVMYEALMGTDYNTYSNDMQNTYDWYSNTMSGRFAKMIIDLCKPIIETVGDVDGILGIKSSYEDGILSKVISVFETYVVFLMIGFGFMLVLIFMRRKATLIHTIVLASFVLCVILGMIRVVPVYIPILYNSATQNIVNDLSYGILTSKMEMYFTNNAAMNKFVVEGKVNSNTGTITIYKFNRKQLNELCNREAIDRQQLLAGKTYVLDENNGLYIEGDSLKVSLDKLFSNPVQGNYVGADSNKTYEFEYHKLYSSNLDYYCPYNLILDNFIDRLNEFVRIYNVPRHVNDYGGGFFKDSFAMYSYANSSLLLKPGNYSTELEENGPDVVTQLQMVFGDNKDFLGISELFYHTDDPLYRETLWWKTLEDNGYIKYTPGTMNLSDESKERISALIEYVNYQTKRFIIEDLNDQLGAMSDDNMLKVMSLYATFCFNNKASEYGNWLYPNNINFPEAKLSDVLIGTFTDQYDKFVAMDYNILDYMYIKYDLFHTMLFVVDMVLCFLIAYVFKFTIPIMYILFCLLLIFNFVRGDDNKELLKGYAIVLVKTLVLMIAYSGSFVLAHSFNGSAFSIWILFACSVLVLSFLGKTVMNVLHNPVTMGSTNIMSANNFVSNLFNRNNRRINNVNTNNLRYNRSDRVTNLPNRTPDRFQEYRIGYENMQQPTVTTYNEDDDYRMLHEDN